MHCAAPLRFNRLYNLLLLNFGKIDAYGFGYAFATGRVGFQTITDVTDFDLIARFGNRPSRIFTVLSGTMVRW